MAEGLRQVGALQERVEGLEAHQRVGPAGLGAGQEERFGPFGVLAVPQEEPRLTVAVEAGQEGGSSLIVVRLPEELAPESWGFLVETAPTTQPLHPAVASPQNWDCPARTAPKPWPARH